MWETIIELLQLAFNRGYEAGYQAGLRKAIEVIEGSRP